MSMHIWLNYETWDSLVVAQDTNMAKWLEIYILSILDVAFIYNH